MTVKEFTSKDYVRNFSDELSTFLFGLSTIVLPFLISSIDQQIGRIVLTAGVAATTASFITGVILNKNNSEGNNSKPLVAENTPVIIVDFKTANATR